jgi:hypothetical protein
MVDLLQSHGDEVTADIAAIYRQACFIRDLLAGGKADPTEILRFGASGGDPEGVGMALERVVWPHHDERWLGILTKPLHFWHHIPYTGLNSNRSKLSVTCLAVGAWDCMGR